MSLTADTLYTANFKVTSHASLDGGGTVTTYRCVEHPQFTKIRTRTAPNERVKELLYVCGLECGSLEEVAEALSGLETERNRAAQRATDVVEAAAP